MDCVLRSPIAAAAVNYSSSKNEENPEEYCGVHVLKEGNVALDTNIKGKMSREQK